MSNPQHIEEHLGLSFRRTCSSHPEQYDVFDENNNQVAYVRLRYGTLRVVVPEFGGETVLHQDFADYRGAFEGPGERDFWLNVAARRILGQT